MTPSSWADDYLSWDMTEAARLEVARRVAVPPDLDPLLATGPHARPVPPSKNRIVPLPVAKRRLLTKRELAASGGAYTGLDRAWLVPAAVLPQSFVIKPADVVVDVTGARWTALEADLGKGGQTWKLVCRNLTLAYDLSETITVERAQVVYDAAGVAVKLFPSGPPPTGGEVLYAGLLARVQLENQPEVDERGYRGSERRYDVIVAQELDVIREDRILLSDKVTYLDILDYHQAQRIDQLPVIEARRKV